jgi:hypothetical protein
METLTLERFAYAPQSTFGRLRLGNGTILYTCEDPWKDNRVGESCIPEGGYVCKPRRYNKGGYEAVQILDDGDGELGGRSLILIHKGNTHEDTAGCVLLGTALGAIGDSWAVKHSKQAFDLFMQQYGGRRFRLWVTHYRPFGNRVPAPERYAGAIHALQNSFRAGIEPPLRRAEPLPSAVGDPLPDKS